MTQLKSLTTLIIIALLTAGAWLFGGGLYIKAKAEVAQVLLDRAWDETLETGAATKPWSWFDTWPVAKVEVQRLQTSAIVLASASGQAMAFGPGHMAGTPTPGARGLSVIAAHRDTHFAFLQDVKIGDEFTITNQDGSTHTFQVTDTAIVHTDHSGLEAHGAGHRVALVTCYPFDALTQGPLRYVVLGERV